MDAQKKVLTRRRFLSVCAMASAVSVLPVAQVIAAVPLHRWRGILLGAEVGLTLAHPDKHTAERIFERVVNEIKRLENIFTLYDSYSELSRLNAAGMLRNPSPEMVDILQQAFRYNTMTKGAFDVTVKPLEDEQSLELIGMNKLEVDQNEIRFKQQGMRITLNGIAQGYITDRITDLLKQEGLRNVLVELGEKRAIGGHPTGRPWFLALSGVQEPVAFVDMALATSASVSPNTGRHHIYNPHTGRYVDENRVISVLAKHASMADALSTGLLAFSRDEIDAMNLDDVRVFL